MGFAACTSMSNIQKETKGLERKVNESISALGKRICDQLGEGVHHSITDSQDPSAEYQVRCEEHGGREVIEINNFKVNERMNYPVPKRLNKETLKEYVADKEIILFGDEHHEESKERTMQFKESLSILKESGFNYIGLEIMYPFQGAIEDYEQEKISREKLLQTLPFYPYDNEKFVEMIDEAKAQGMKVICLDNRDRGRKIERDEYMRKKVEEVRKKEGKLAALVGAAHVRDARTTEFYIPSEVNIPGAVQVVKIKPLARRLIEQYGKANIGTIDLTGCDDSYIDACVE